MHSLVSLLLSAIFWAFCDANGSGRYAVEPD